MIEPKTSRELAALVRNGIQMDTSLGAIAREEKATMEATALIEAYARMREARLLEEAATAIGSVYAGSDAYADGVLAAAQRRIRALSKARKQPEQGRMQPAGEANDRS